MNRLFGVRFSVFLSFAAVAVSHAYAHDDPFDVESGSVVTKYSGALVNGTIIDCNFQVEEAYFGDRWLPMVAIAFYSEEQTDDNDQSESLFLKLSANRSNEEEGWNHDFLMSEGEDKESRISAYTGETEEVLPIDLWLVDDRTVIFSVGGRDADFSTIDISPHALVRWKVLVSGVKGTGDCDSRIIDLDDDE